MAVMIHGVVISTCGMCHSVEHRLHMNEQGSSQYTVHPAYMYLTTLQLEAWWLPLCAQHTLSICLVSTPAHHPEHTSAQEPQPSNLHSCSKHIIIHKYKESTDNSAGQVIYNYHTYSCSLISAHIYISTGRCTLTFLS